MIRTLLLAGATFAAIAEPAAAQDAQGWITDPAAASDVIPVVLHFRRVVELKARPMHFPVRVTADNRYVLFVNGERVSAGPSVGDVAHWREQAIDLAPYLRAGRNVVAAVVWNGVQPVKVPPNATPGQIEAARWIGRAKQSSPNFQQSVATGFRIVGEEAGAVISTALGGWRVERDEGRGFENSEKQLRSNKLYYVAAPPEVVDASKTDWDWAGAEEHGTGWRDAVSAPDAALRGMVLDRLPPQTFAPTVPGRVVRSDLAGGAAFPARPITVPANSSVKLLIQREAMVSAYPQLDVAGGAGATIAVTWTEALYDKDLRKGDRDEVGERIAHGIHDTFLPDGNDRTFATLWWRTWRFAEISVHTGDRPLELKAMRAFETGYPFRQVGSFSSDDPTLATIFDIGWRTARIDAHETYMDSAYWEQLQYAGDTRLQMLISYAVSGDPRLAEQAIDAFAASNVSNGLVDGAYPERFANPIAPFSFAWVGMLDDWRMRQPDPAPIVRNLDRMREILRWFKQWQQPSGLLGKNPEWNFIDWVGQLASDRTRFPSYGKTNESCLMTVVWLGALEQGARIEAALGDKALGQDDHQQAERLKGAIRARCWIASRGLFADNPDGDLFSQHMNVLAVLYDVVSPSEARDIFGRILVPGKGIDAPAGMSTSSYYFASYLAQALVHAGLADRYLELLDTWRDLLKLHYTTWPEERGDTRSDTHAWSAHPTADLLGIVAGIGPGEPGYRSVRISPALGRLTRLSATAATPAGPVSVRYRLAAGKLVADIVLPRSLRGTFMWREESHALTKAHSRLVLTAD
jgi:alpha-L-rhamnosidase